MTRTLRPWIGLAAIAVLLSLAGASTVAGQQDEFRFRSGVDLVNVTATVTDRNGRFVPGLRQEDFIVYEENELQEVTHFSNERVPVSLGIVLDTSGSMVGEKLTSALAAIGSGWLFKVVLITRAAYNQGFALPRTAVRGAGSGGRPEELPDLRLRDQRGRPHLAPIGRYSREPSRGPAGPYSLQAWRLRPC